ncbi:MAG: CHASE domain-containing protein [Burkholderiales bacterium]
MTKITARLFPKGSLVAWMTLAILLLVTTFAWYVAKAQIESAARIQFTFRVGEIEQAIRARMLAYEKVLQGGVGLLAANDNNVSRTAWRAYIDSLKIEADYPGVQGIGLSKIILPEALDDHVRAVRAEGFPNYTVRPPGPRDLYTSIIYLEPFLGRNLRAFGYDMYSEPVRRAAMQRARDNAVTAISGRVVLVQETSKDVQAGFLMYAPVYRVGREIETVEQRRNALHGFVYSPFRMNDLMRGIIGRELPDLALRIYDDEELLAAGLLYRDDALERRIGTNFIPAFRAIRPIAVNGHVWMLDLRSAPYSEAVTQQEKPGFILIAGILISFLFFVVVWSGVSLRARALTLAEKMANAHRRSEGRLRAILDNVVDGIITVDETGTIESANPAAEAIFGWSVTALVGKDVDSLIAEEYRGVGRQVAHAGNAVGRDLFDRTRFEVVGIRQSGERFPMELAFGEMRIDGRGTLIGVVRDVTDRKKAERLKNEFVATVSHELRTPLTSIRGSLSLIAGNAAGDVSTKAKHLVDVAYRNCDRLIRLINDMLDIQKIEAGRVEYKFEMLTLQPLLEQSIESNTGFAEQFGVVLKLDAPEKPIAVFVDADRFVRVMSNLLSNAAKYSPRGEQVIIRAKQEADRVSIEVVDQGAGIPEEFRDRIFEKFSQADASDSRQKGGTGLGLNISKRLVEGMKGTIDFTSEMGRGTTFRVELPAIAPEKPLERETHAEVRDVLERQT